MGEHPAIAMARRQLSEGQGEKGLETIRAALRRAPADPELNYNAAGILLEAGKPDQAQYFAERAAGLAPQRGLYRSLLGEVLMHLGKFAAAEKSFREAIRLDGKLYSARHNLANIRINALDYEEAETLLREAWALRPERAEAPVNLANVLVETARAAEGRAVAEACQAKHPHDPLAAACLANLLNYAPGVDRGTVAAAHARFGELIGRTASVLPPAPIDRSPDRPLRVAFVSADFREHSVAYFIEPVLRHLPRGAMHVIAVSRVLKPDAMTARLRALADEWIDASAMGDRRLAEEIRAHRVDVCIELSGLTQGNALGAMAMRPAPVQLSYLGYPNTSGLAAIGGRLADAITDPPAEGPVRKGEQTLRLDPVFLCYRSAAQVRGEAWDREAPARDASRPGPVFASFNVMSKMNEPLADAWAQALHRTPGSRLLLKARSLGGKALRARITAWFEARGISADRLELVDYVPSHADHLALYRRVDVALDPFPYNGTTTTCEALSMGVPVVTLRGASHAGRVGASLLTAAGAPELITETADGYAAAAAALAQDPGRLAEYRRTLRGRLMDGPLGDGPAMGARMAAAIRSAWRAWCGGNG